MRKQLNKVILLGILIQFLASCTPQPEEINFGTDSCEYCKMTIADPKFGAQLVTEKGRVYKFDAVECMVHYRKENRDQKYAYELAVAYDNPEKLIPVNELFFLFDQQYKSPMGKNLAAFKNLTHAKSTSDPVDWERVKISLSQ